MKSVIIACVLLAVVTFVAADSEMVATSRKHYHTAEKATLKEVNKMVRIAREHNLKKHHMGAQQTSQNGFPSDFPASCRNPAVLKIFMSMSGNDNNDDESSLKTICPNWGTIRQCFSDMLTQQTGGGQAGQLRASGMIGLMNAACAQVDGAYCYLTMDSMDESNCEKKRPSDVGGCGSKCFATSDNRRCLTAFTSTIHGYYCGGCFSKIMSAAQTMLKNNYKAQMLPPPKPKCIPIPTQNTPTWSVPSGSWPSGSIPSWPAGSIPSIPAGSIPSWPAGSIPSWPAGSIPSIPAGSIPSWPAGSIPSIPAGSIPSWPAGSIPSIPAGSIPSWPAGSIPSIPAGSIPSWPAGSIPSIPAGSIPSWPAGSIPSIPAGSIPSWPAGSIPSIPAGSIPSWPAGSIPSWPAGSIPSGSWPSGSMPFSCPAGMMPDYPSGGGSSGGDMNIEGPSQQELDAMVALRNAVCAKHTTSGKFCVTELGLLSTGANGAYSATNSLLDPTDSSPVTFWPSATVDTACGTVRNKMCFRKVTLGIVAANALRSREIYNRCVKSYLSSYSYSECRRFQYIATWKIATQLKTSAGICLKNTMGAYCAATPIKASSAFPSCIRAIYRGSCTSSCESTVKTALSGIGCCANSLYPRVSSLIASGYYSCRDWMASRLSSYDSACTIPKSRFIARKVLKLAIKYGEVQNNATLYNSLLESLTQDMASSLGIPEEALINKKLLPQSQASSAPVPTANVPISSWPSGSWPAGSIPSWPPGSIPSIPAGSIPSWPAGSIPSWPAGSIPSIPAGSIPSWPAGSIPSIPAGSIPSWPAGSIPSIPAGSIPSWPPGSIPSWPPGSIPSMAANKRGFAQLANTATESAAFQFDIQASSDEETTAAASSFDSEIASGKEQLPASTSTLVDNGAVTPGQASTPQAPPPSDEKKKSMTPTIAGAIVAVVVVIAIVVIIVVIAKRGGGGGASNQQQQAGNVQYQNMNSGNNV